MFRLEAPLFLLFFLLLPVLVYRFCKGARGILFSSFQGLPGDKSWRIRLLFLPEVFFFLSLAGMILAIARPIYYKGQVSDTKKGLILEMVLDRSSSMGTWMDKERKQNRLDIAKSTFLGFVDDRPDDIIGLTVFAGYADTLSPLTVSHDVFPQFIQTVDLAEKDVDGTAVGDAIALGIGRIESFRAGLEYGAGQDAVLILLTDGQNNKGAITPLEAADLAAERGITVYTIGFGGGYYQNPFGFWQKIPPEYEVDSQTLAAVAEKTGGLYFNADDEASLRKIYEKIDKLEKTEVDNISYQERNELYQIFLIYSIALFLLGMFFREVLFPVVENDYL